ncbi:unnamed protein product, partial [Lymnaea stagnalis]
MDVAANTIKMALEKSSGSKRKQSHRKYLQRRVKNSGDSQQTIGHTNVTSTKRITKLSQSQSLDSLFDITNFKKQEFIQNDKTQDESLDFSVSPQPKFTLKSRKLPPSFFVEPAVWQNRKGGLDSKSSIDDDTSVDMKASPSLPTDTLESILGQADLQDILNVGNW